MSYPHHHYPDHLLLQPKRFRNVSKTFPKNNSSIPNVIILFLIPLYLLVVVGFGVNCTKIPLPLPPPPSSLTSQSSSSYSSLSSHSSSSSASSSSSSSASSQSLSDLSSTDSISSLSSSHHHHHPNRQLQLHHQKQQQNSYYPVIAEHRLIMQDRAILHLNLMNTIGSCREPRPVVVYPTSSPNKAYFPRGTLLYRCNDQVGCCPNNLEVCRPETIESVEKVFFVNHFVVGQKISGHRITPRLKPRRQNFTTVTESISFVNHTGCKCVKLAPNAIEHDEQQSVVSRPLVVPLTPTFGSSSFLFHLIGTLSVIALVVMLFFIYKCVIFR